MVLLGRARLDTDERPRSAGVAIPMNTIIAKREMVTTIEAEDHARFLRIIDRLGPYAEVPPLGGYRHMGHAEVWLKLVGQVCVMGSSRGMAAINADRRTRTQFAKAASLRSWSASSYRVSALAKVLKDFKATRFATRAAGLLREVAKSPEVVRNDRCVLLRHLSHDQDVERIRRTLMDRCPIFKLKSASDFMINVGLSQDVIALDLRVVGTLEEHFGFNLSASQVQARERIYLSVEETLRAVCREAGVTLGVLDRCIFQFGGMSALDFALRHGQ